MNDMTLSVQDAIKKNLPAQVANELSEFIEKAAKDAQELATLRETNKHLEERVNTLYALERREGQIKDREAVLTKAEAEVEAKERALREATLVIQLAEANRRADELHNLVGRNWEKPESVADLICPK